MSNGTVLITGIEGFTGAHLAGELAANGYRVAGTGQTAGVSGSNYVCDITRLDTVRSVVDKLRPDYVVHLAGLSHVGHGDPEAFYRVNLFGATNLLQALYEVGHPIRKVLLVSSANVYGLATQEVLGEDLCPRPINHYGCSKLAMEYMSATWFDRLPIVITRPFNYTGPGQSDSFVIPKIVSHFRDRKDRIELGNIDVEREFSDVRDVCAHYRLLLEAGLQGQIVNICSGRGYSLRAIIAQMSEIAARPIEIDVNSALVRANEIPRLVGSNQRLHRAIGERQYRPIAETLRWMYGVQPST